MQSLEVAKIVHNRKVTTLYDRKSTICNSRDSAWIQKVVIFSA